MRKKLDNKGEYCTFLNLSNILKAYKLYNFNTIKIIINRDVLFDEKATWLWNQNDIKENIRIDFDDNEKV